MTWWIVVAVGLASGLLALLLVRRRARRAPGVFACRLRPVDPRVVARRRSPRQHAHWVHDVLVIHRGATNRFGRTLPVAHVSGPAVVVATRRLGAQPVALRLQLDDGRLFDLQTRNVDAAAALGPFAN